ncbi:MAG: molybdenum cofactor guanylyltransferase [Firmicutes bacterium]|nr:molybdenum cofactor guanylyltransferase [Bacillota bacterium]
MMLERTGIVLAGGLSTRMGRDKASLPWGGVDLLHNVLRSLVPVCGQLIVVSNVERAINIPDVIVVRDKYCGCGPLGGIHAGLSVSMSTYNFVVACDMPFVQSSLVDYMFRLAEGYDAVVPFVDGHYHPLHAIYSRQCLALIEIMLKDGRYRVAELFEELNMLLVKKGDLKEFDRDCSMLCNLNSPADVEKVLKNNE